MSDNGEIVIDLDSHIVERADRFYQDAHRTARVPRAVPAALRRGGRLRAEGRQASALSLRGTGTGSPRR